MNWFTKLFHRHHWFEFKRLKADVLLSSMLGERDVKPATIILYHCPCGEKKAEIFTMTKSYNVKYEFAWSYFEENQDEKADKERPHY